MLGVNTNRLGEGFYLAIAADEAMQERVKRLAAGDLPQRRHLGVSVVPGFVARKMRRAVGLPDADGVLVRGVVAATRGVVRRSARLLLERRAAGLQQFVHHLVSVQDDGAQAAQLPASVAKVPLLFIATLFVTIPSLYVFATLAGVASVCSALQHAAAVYCVIIRPLCRPGAGLRYSLTGFSPSEAASSQ